MTKFKRTSPGRYADTASGWTIVRDGGETGRHDRRDWLVKDQTGRTVRVRPSKTEAEMAAHKALDTSQSAL